MNEHDAPQPNQDGGRPAAPVESSELRDAIRAMAAVAASIGQAPTRVDGKTTIPISAVWVGGVAVLSGLATVCLMFWRISDNMANRYVSNDVFNVQMDSLRRELQDLGKMVGRQDTLMVQFAELKVSVEALKHSDKGR